MLVVVATPVTQIDAAHERDVTRGIARTPDQHQLLMVRSGSAHALVERDLAAGGVDRTGQFHVVLHVEARELRMRSPDEATHLDPAARVAEHVGEGLPVDQPLLGVASPVGERHRVARLRLTQGSVQRLEVRATVDQRLDRVPGRPCTSVAPSIVDRGRRVHARRGEEPLVLLLRVPRHGVEAYRAGPG